MPNVDRDWTISIHPVFIMNPEYPRSDLMELMLIRYAIAVIQSERRNSMPTLEIPIRDFYGFLWKNPDYASWSEIAARLSRKRIKLPNLDTGREFDTPVFSECAHLRGRAVIRLKFSDELYPFIAIGEKNVVAQARLTGLWLDMPEWKSERNWRIYGILVRYRGEVRYTFEELRALLGLGNKYRYASHIVSYFCKSGKEACEAQDDSEIEFDFRPWEERSEGSPRKKRIGVVFRVKGKNPRGRPS